MLIVGYIDPGSGSMLLQVILAGVLAVPFFFRRTFAEAWRRIRGDRDDRGTGPATANDADRDDA